MTRRCALAFCLAVCLLALRPGQAQEAPQTLPQAPQTLPQALARVRLPADRVALTVSVPPFGAPERATLAEDADLADVARAFGRLTQRFGAVSALAPPTMVVLNDAPGPPDVFRDLPRGAALKLLAATLTPPQWQALTGSGGLGLADLAGDEQRALFRAALGADTLKVLPVVPGGGGAGQPIDLTDELPQARLRLGRKTQIMLPVGENSWRGWGAGPPSSAPHYFWMHDYSPHDAVSGVALRAEVPNVPKKSDLDFAAPALRVAVPLDGLKTVGDLVARAGGLTRIEMYADPHYAGKALTVAGAAGAPAGDLLRALALCLTGTFRRVGPAIVLTDDILGVGTRREILSQFAQDADALRRRPLAAAGDVIAARHDPLALRDWADAGLGLSEAQIAQGQYQGMNPFDSSLRLPFDRLTSGQQAEASRLVAEHAADAAPPGMSPAPCPTLRGEIMLQGETTLEALVPGLDGPVDAGAELSDLFRPSDKLQNEMMQAHWKRREELRKQERVTQPSAPTLRPPAPPRPSLAATLRAVPRRAVLARPRSVAELEALVASMQALGLNQLWLVVFPDEPPGGPDLVAEALKATQGRGIGVFPVLDLLTWGRTAPPDARDLSILGETSAEQQARQRRRTALAQPEGASSPPPDGKVARLSVSPFAPAVRSALLERVAALAALPGLAGVVWRETAPPGYDADTNRAGYVSFGGLGYTEPARLAFLRRERADPVDVDGGNGSGADTHLPNWEGAGADLLTVWNRFRADADRDLLQSLWRAWSRGRPAHAVSSGPPPRPIFLAKRGTSFGADWFGSWDAPGAPLPAYRLPWENGPDGPRFPQEAALQAKSQSQLALLRVPGWVTRSGPNLAAYLHDNIAPGTPAKAWDGFVLDVTPEEAGPAPAGKAADPLAPLVADLKPSPEAGAKGLLPGRWRPEMVSSSGGPGRGAGCRRVCPASACRRGPCSASTACPGGSRWTARRAGRGRRTG